MNPASCPLNQRITERYPELTGKARQLADYLQLNSDKMLILSTAEIAEACKVSKTSVSRFIRQLGYQDHQQLRQELRASRERGEPVAAEPSQGDHLQQEISNLQQLWQHIDQAQLEQVVERLASAKRVKIIGYRNSYPLALHLRQQLSQCRQDVELLPLPGQTLGEELANLNQDDLVFLIGIRRRTHGFADLVEHLQGQACVLLTDQSGQKYAKQVSHLLVCPMGNHGALDSYAAPMSLLANIANQVYDWLGNLSKQQSGQISRHYQQLQELEQ